MKKTLFVSATILFCSLILIGCGKLSGEELNKFCTENAGTWVSEYTECENVSQEVCEDSNGTFKECESSCRHHPEILDCTMQCVPVCQLENQLEKVKE